MKNEKSLKQLLQSQNESLLKKMLERKLNRANGRRSGHIDFSGEEVENVLEVVNDLTARVDALEKENTCLSLFGLNTGSL